MPYVTQSELERLRMQSSGNMNQGWTAWIPLIIAMLRLPSLREEETSIDTASSALGQLQPTSSGNVNGNVDVLVAQLKDTIAKRKTSNRAERLAILVNGVFYAFASGSLGGMSSGGMGGGGAILVVLIVLLLSQNNGGLLGGIL